MGKNTDKLYITHSEWSGPDKHSSSGGISSRKVGKSNKRLVFTHCNVSLIPFVNPVCDLRGNIYDRKHILDWIAKHGTNPLTGEPLLVEDLITLHFQKNDDGEYIDPVTYKVLTPSSHIVCLKPSGNVFTWDTIEQLNIKAKNWSDIVSGQKFSRSDILILQDPLNISKDVALNNPNKLSSSQQPKFLTKSDEKSAKRPADITDDQIPKKKSLPYNASVASTGRAAAGLTSTASTPYTRSDRQLLTDEEFLLKPRRVIKVAYVQIRTNLGNLNLELQPQYAPKAVYNFIKLAESGYYEGVKFHRNISKFMIQGGDPSGTGRGGQSHFGRPFEDEFNSPLSHDSRGVISMANKGKNTNTSQFFILYGPKPSLDKKHTVFGKVVGGSDVLDKMEKTPVDSNDRPLLDIVIRNMSVISDPFKEYMAELKDKETNGAHEVTTASKANDSDEKFTWTGKLVRSSKSESTPEAGVRRGVGKYL
ncbi:cyclophilin-like domain-containing protein [Lipomyces japonicus]|uniref:cyclophilin-like domain-containing protein n=1 Tax=Lipomyces japonicus TaxID=56871 RepID=UPI0034CE514B